MRPNPIAHAVIGAQFGDEGKGRVLDYYAAMTGENGIVVRFNGGAQAGHTVVTPDGLRHVFSHIGSGALAGAATFLSRFFVSNPMLFLKEWATPAVRRIKPAIYVDPDSPVTTPYDMLINQLVEQERGIGRHGSCGIGFGETIERNLAPDYALTVRDLVDRTVLAEKLDAVRREYAPARLAWLGYGTVYTRHAEWFQSDMILERFMADTGRFMDAVVCAEAQTAIQGRTVLFEGAQGLRLDQERGFFPYVTRSHTGLRNVLTLASEWGLERLTATYVTRVYTTRHGAGPLPHEVSGLPYPGIADATNVPNAYQGTLRFGWLDVDLLQSGIADDLSDAGAFAALDMRVQLAVTCLDQVGDGRITSYQDGVRCRDRLDPLIAAMAESVGASSVLLGFGAKRDALRCE